MSTRLTVNGPLDDISFAIDEHGDPAGLPVVWLHGALGPMGDPPFASALRDGVRLLAVHHLGFGMSTGVEHFDHIADLAVVYWWMLDQLGIENVTLVGHCFGGALAAEMAAQQPQRLTGLALVAPFGMFREDEPGVDIFATMQRDLMPAIYADPGGPLAVQHFPAPIDAHHRGLQSIHRVEVLSASSRFLFPIPDTGIESRLYRIARVPTELVWGVKDGVTPVSLAEDWSAAILHAATTKIDGASHMVPYEAPDAVAAAIGRLSLERLLR